VDVALLMSDARRALAAARAEIARGDRPTAVLMLASARTRLGLIDERLQDQRFAALRLRLRKASAELAAAQETLRAGADPPDHGFDRWLADARPLEAALTAAEPQSLFDPDRLRLAARKRQPS
jgi:hypothetical protein